MNPLEKYIASCSPEITNILNNYLANRRREEEYYNVDTFGDEYLEEQGANIAETRTDRTMARGRKRGQK
jgi:hypothetical protein